MKPYSFYTAGAIALFASALAVALPADAKVRAFGSNSTPFVSSSATFVDLPIKGTATSISFNMPADDFVVITFSTECSVSGTSIVWANLQIVLNGKIVKPTGHDTTLCSDNTTAIHDGFVQVSKSVAAKAITGNNVLKIRAKLAFTAPGAEYRLEDTSTVVHE